MAFYDSILESNLGKVGAGVLVTVGAVLLVPVLIPAVASAVKPVVKGAIKGGMILFEKGNQLVSESMEMLEDITAEAKAELLHEKSLASAAAATESAAAQTPPAGAAE